MPRKESDQIRRYSEEITRKRELLKTKAQEMGLKHYPTPTSTVWAEEEYEPGQLPGHFYVEDYLGDKEPELKEYKITFPMKDFDQFVENLEALRAFYISTEDVIKYDRAGKGLSDFLRNLVKGQQKSRLD